MSGIVLTLIAIFYVQDPFATALLMICLLGTGYYVLTNGTRFLDRGR